MSQPDANETTSRILAVDDHPTNLTKISFATRNLGYHVELATGGQQALQILRDRSIDLILLDLLMPEMDGFEVLEVLKLDAELRRIPVIVISSLEDIGSVVKAIELGAEDYLPKNFDPVCSRPEFSPVWKRRDSAIAKSLS